MFTQAEVEAKKREANAMHDREVAARQAEADAKRRQQEAAHHDAVAAFQTLLAETVKDPAARWQVASVSDCMQAAKLD